MSSDDGWRRSPSTSRRTSTGTGRPGRSRAARERRTGRAKVSRAVRRLPVIADPARVEVLAECWRSDSACSSRSASSARHSSESPRSGPGHERTCAHSHTRTTTTPSTSPTDERDRDDERPHDPGVGEAGRERQPAESGDEEGGGDGIPPPTPQAEGAVDRSGEHEVDPRHRRHDRPTEAAGPDDRDEDGGHRRDPDAVCRGGAQLVTQRRAVARPEGRLHEREAVDERQEREDVGGIAALGSCLGGNLAADDPVGLAEPLVVVDLEGGLGSACRRLGMEESSSLSGRARCRRRGWRARPSAPGRGTPSRPWPLTRRARG